jgi:hypothetical protein
MNKKIGTALYQDWTFVSIEPSFWSKLVSKFPYKNNMYNNSEEISEDEENISYQNHKNYNNSQSNNYCFDRSYFKRYLEE